MINFKQVIVKKFHPNDQKVKELIQDICSNLEKQYLDEYSTRYLKMLDDDILKNVYIVFYNKMPIGLRVLRIIDGKSFKQKGTILRTTMFRIIPRYRNQGIGRQVFVEINNLIFKEYKMDILYSESKEFGALKLYFIFGNIHIFEKQYTNNIEFNIDILSSGLPNNFMFDKDIKFMIMNSNTI